MHKQITVIEVPWGILSEEQKGVADAIQSIWENEGLGNDFYYYPWHSNRSEYPALHAYMQANKIEGKVLLHYSW
jgi:hypothetical protein